MTTYPVIRLKPDREVHLKNKHHAIFRPIVEGVPAVAPGGIVEVQSSKGDFLCYATYNAKAYICGRAISFEPGDPLEGLKKTITKAIELRKTLFSDPGTNAYRLINAEGDGVPGLIVDRYGDVVVMQLTTLGMDRLKMWIIDTLWELTKPTAIFEKSTGQARKKEGLEPREMWARGNADTSFEIMERGLKYKIVLEGSQKTGLFLDQREMRSVVRDMAMGRTVLDVCSYVGGFSLSALAGGALAADAVDYDAGALETAKANMALNGMDMEKFGTYAQDAFEFLRARPLKRPYDFIILDPPAFAKRSTDIDQAKHAYTDLNRMAMQMLPPGSLLLTCSCSYQMDPALFQTVVFHAARQAGRFVRILHRHRQAVDHPINIYHPEVDYLKSLLLWVE